MTFAVDKEIPVVKDTFCLLLIHTHIPSPSNIQKFQLLYNTHPSTPIFRNSIYCMGANNKTTILITTTRSVYSFKITELSLTDMSLINAKALQT